ncbi:MAG TPA: ABC transporter permease [Candidatus Acidoferrum sp.]|nr:ABC transporter permease [Candidatus Acidoferrum sp.]
MLPRLRHLFRNLARKNERDDDLDAELRGYVEMLAEEKMREGMKPEEARRAARIELGGVEQVKEQVRDARAGAWLDSLLQDLRYGLRMLRKSPGFTLVAVLTLALGIGANAAIFSILESQLWRPLPFPDSERLADPHVVLRQNPKQRDVLSARVFRAWREQSRSFSNLAGYFYPGSRNFTANGTSERVLVMPTTSNFFDTLKVSPARGRAFIAGEETPGRDHVVILSYSLWQDRFASDPALLGKPITLDGEAYTVVGIAPANLRFEFMDEPAIYVPLAIDPAGPAVRYLGVIGRLAPGVTPDRAARELTSILDRELKSEGVPSEDTAVVANLREERTRFAARPLYFFAGAVALVLLIACVNTAGLLLARGLARQREFAVRAALGARRGRIIRQLLVESVLLALAGGAAGTLAGFWLAGWFAAAVPEDTLPRHAPIALDGRVLLFTLAVSIVSALLAGVLPAVFASRSDFNSGLRQSAPGRSATRSQRFARSSLVAIEVALGLVLLFGAGLFMASFVRLQEAPRGFDAPGSLTFRISLRGENYAKPEQARAYFDRLTEQLRSLPGARTVTLGSGLPLTGSESLFATVNVAGRPPVDPHGSFVILHSVAPNYFDALHMHLLAGRAFDSKDAETSPRVAVLNRNAAQDLFGTESPIGKVLEFVADQRRGMPPEAPVQIVGIVDNAHEFNADEVPFDTLYLPFAQHPVPSSFVLVASEIPRGALAAGIRATAYALDEDQPIFDMKTMDDRVSDSLAGARFNLLLVGALAAVAVILVSVGTFGTVSYFVQQRTQEFGIRLALGATPATILRHAISQSLLIGMTGMSIGVATSVILGRLLRYALYLVPHEHTGMLYGVSIYDPLTLGSACALLTLMLLLASYVPARRAMRVDPLVALRHE